jgi:hypothetical protein
MTWSCCGIPRWSRWPITGEHLGEHGLWEHRPPGCTQVLQVPLVVD